MYCSYKCKYRFTAILKTQPSTLVVFAVMLSNSSSHIKYPSLALNVLKHNLILYMDNKHLHIGPSASCSRTLPSMGLDKKQNIYTSRINSLSCHYYHIASNRTSLQRCKLVMYAYAATCLDNKQRDEDYHSCSACMANMAVFVCQWDLSVCFGRSLPLEFKNVCG